jgi:uncharacterized protein YndB with AHSA1/START domain
MQATDVPILLGTVTESIAIDAPVDAVFRALSESDIRSVWAKLPGRDNTYALDFREGGSEVRTSTFPNIEADELLDLRTRFVEIAAPRRVVELVELRLDGVLRTASLVAWELTEQDGGTRVDYAEQYQVLTPTGDGTADHKERKGATPMMLRRFKITVEQNR